MVSFRYHLVSLIAVFLALALGIVLGSGPLATGIGDSLSGDLRAVREERDELTQDLKQEQGRVSDRDAALTSALTSAAAGSLTDQQVALVVLPGASDEDVTAIADAVTAAGATTVTARFTEAWEGVDASFLQGYAGQIAGYVDSATGARPEAVVAAAVAEALRDATIDGSDAAILTELLTSDDVDFLAFDAEPTAPSTALVLVGPRETPTPVEGAADRDPTSMVTGFSAVIPTVTVGATTPERDGLVDGVRTGDVVATTIDSVGQTPAALSVPLALVEVLGGTAGHYGSGQGAAAPIPPLP